jgi:hypothetical protein
MQIIFMKKCFLSTVSSVCRVKRFSFGGKRFADDEEVQTEVRKWLIQQQKRLICCESRRTGRATEQVYQCWCSRWGDNIKMDLREIGWEGTDWMDLTQDRNRWRALVNTE